MAHGVMEEWSERDGGGEKSPGSTGRVMGSRRIFAPLFKLQVLDSYRQDPDCKGNQRATARKYGIHRRQIQKWLQMEDNLRSIAGGSAALAQASPSSPGSIASLASVASLSLASPPPHSPAPSPSPSSHSEPLAGPCGPGAAGGAPAGVLAGALAGAAYSALNLSCEARLLGGVVMRGVGAIGGASPPSGRSGSSSPASPFLAGSPAHSPPPSPATRVPVPRLSASPTLPIKKRWFVSPEPPAQSSSSSPPLLGAIPMATGSDDEDEDDDDEDIDVDGTESETSSALDYTTATLSKRRSFSLQFKLAVLDAFREDPQCQGNQRATARTFGINRRQVQKWLVQEPELREEAVSRGGLNRQRLGRWMDQEEAVEGGCLDLSRKRKTEPATSDLDDDDAEAEAKKLRLKACPETMPPTPSRAAPLGGDLDAFRPHPGLPRQPLLFGPQPLLHPLPLPLQLPLPPLPFCTKYSVDLKLSRFDFDPFTAYQQNLQKLLKREDFLPHTSNTSFLLNPFR